MRKLDQKWSAQESSDQSKTLNLTIDPTKSNGQSPPAVMISRTIQAIVRRCTGLAITLRFVHCRCRLSPVSALETETFPGVTKLVVYVGRYHPDFEERNDREANPCQPSAKFWRPFVNGLTFPDCVNLEIRHYWATTPPADTSLDLGKEYPAHDMYDGFSLVPGSHFGRRVPSHNIGGYIGNTEGLKRFESILLECPPELNSALLMQLLGNPNAVASNLTSLELRFCNLTFETYSTLLYHAPPQVRSFVLLCCDYPDIDYHGPHRGEVPHLCPLLGDFSRKLIHLEFGAPKVCRELFFDDLERQSLRLNGIQSSIGSRGGAVDIDPGGLDGHALREVVQACRKQKRMEYRNDRIREAVTAATSSSSSESPSNSLFGGHQRSDPNQLATKIERETEALLDEEEARRSRQVEGSKKPWFRRFIAYQGLCNRTGPWAELQIAAEMEEKGIELVLVSKSGVSLAGFLGTCLTIITDKKLKLASQHSNGKPAVDINLNDALREKYDLSQKV